MLRAGDEAGSQSASALEQLCQAYWYPLYAFVQRQRHEPEEAQDLTQKFFARRSHVSRFGKVTKAEKLPMCRADSADSFDACFHLTPFEESEDSRI